MGGRVLTLCKHFIVHSLIFKYRQLVLSGIFSTLERVPPVHTGDTLLYDTLDLLEHVWVFFIDPVSQVSAVIQNLTRKSKQSGRCIFDKGN